ncbi:MAG: hypothetical protein E7040_03260 [Lentisphaerae bacterium]|nr:hypothetical protein [Lentisphaerota bacterium]
MFPTLKKTVAAVAFVIAFAVVASPLSYLPKEIQMAGYVNVSTLLEHPAFQTFIPMIDKDLKEGGLSVKDFDGKAALGFDFKTEKNKMQANVNIVLELKRPTAKKIFESIIKENPKAKFTLKGKPAWQDEDFRVILFSDRVLIAQIHAEGNKPYLTPGNQILTQKEFAQLENFDAAVIVNIEDVLKNIGEIKPEDKDVIELFSKIKTAAFLCKVENKETVSMILAGECKSAKDAELLESFVKSLINEAVKDIPNLKPLLERIQQNRNGKNLIYSIKINKNDVFLFEKLINDYDDDDDEE